MADWGMEDYKFLFKVVLIGNAGVGKTSLVKRFTQNIFPMGQQSTIGVDFMIKNLIIDGEKVKLQIWDTAGQERFRSITQSYYRSANALILVYDISSQATFDCLPQWLSEIETYAGSNVLTYLVGNKCDKVARREIPREKADDFASRHDMVFIETSAKECDNVDQLFSQIAQKLTKDANKSMFATELPSIFSSSTRPISAQPLIDSVKSSCCKTA